MSDNITPGTAREGVLITRKALEKIIRRISDLRRRVERDQPPGGTLLSSAGGTQINAWKITGALAKVGKRYPYEATLVIPVVDGSHYEEPRFKRTTQSLWNDIEEINEGDALPVGLVVYAIEVQVVKDGRPYVEHRIIGVGSSLPKGEFQYMVYQMVSQNTAGWDFVRAHPTL